MQLLSAPAHRTACVAHNTSFRCDRSAKLSTSIASRLHSAARPAVAAAALAAAAVVTDRRNRQRVIAAAAAGDDLPEEYEANEQEDLYDADAADFAEAPLDEESVRERQLMSAEAGPSYAAEPDEDVDEFEDLPFPEPETKALYLCDLLGLASEVDAAAVVQETFADVAVAGITDDPGEVLPGDLYCCVERITPTSIWNGHAPEAIAAAVEAGAAAILAELGTQFPPDLVPDSVPVIYAEEVDELAARLAAVFYDGPGRSMTLVSVAGTSGKTTASWIIRGVLEQAGLLTGMVGSIEHALAEHLMTSDGQLWAPEEPDPAAGRECSSPFHMVPYKGRYNVEETTPSGLRVQKLLAGMRDRGATAAVVECEADAIATGCLQWIEPTIAVFTNLSDDPSSLEMFGSREEYLDCICEWFKRLGDTSKQRAVINIDDPAAPAVVQAASAVPCITFGIDNASADVRVESLELTLWRTTMIVATPVGRLEIITNMVGRHNVYNVLAAVAVGVLLDLPLADIGAGVESVQIVPGRCEVVNNDWDFLDAESEGEQPPPPAANKLPQDFAVVVDAADTPQRLATTLEALREAGAKRVFTVFGCDGQVTSGETRARMGEVAHQRSEFVILTNSSPGLEDPPDIIQDIVSGWPNELFEPYAAYVYNVFQDQTNAPLWFEPFLHSAQRRWQRHIMEDRFQAIRAAIGTATPGDVVLLAGRGHKDWVEHANEEGGITRGWFDDRVEARNALAKLEYLYALVDLDRSKLPWGPAPDEGKSVVVEIE